MNTNQKRQAENSAQLAAAAVYSGSFATGRSFPPMPVLWDGRRCEWAVELASEPQAAVNERGMAKVRRALKGDPA